MRIKVMGPYNSGTNLMINILHNNITKERKRQYHLYKYSQIITLIFGNIVIMDQQYMNILMKTMMFV